MLAVRNVSVAFGDFYALRDVTLTVADCERLCILGPSGSGKSTLLRVVAGLARPLPGGSVLLDGHDVTHVPPHKRDIGLMFQDHALFPHLDVVENVAFGLRARGMKRGKALTQAREYLELVGMEDKKKRAIHTLSGGEAQRVALARALAPSPRLLMLDEPFGQLDRLLRERLLAEIRRLSTELDVTLLAVTHDHAEAELLADRVAIMQEGRIVQTGTLAQLRRAPTSRFVAEFVEPVS